MWICIHPVNKETATVLFSKSIIFLIYVNLHSPCQQQQQKKTHDSLIFEINYFFWSTWICIHPVNKETAMVLFSKSISG